MWYFDKCRPRPACAASFKLRNSKCCSASSWTFIEYSSDLQRLWSDCAYAHACLSLCWAHIPHCWKSHVTAQLYWMTPLTSFIIGANTMDPDHKEKSDLCPYCFQYKLLTYMSPCWSRQQFSWMAVKGLGRSNMRGSKRFYQRGSNSTQDPLSTI